MNKDRELNQRVKDAFERQSLDSDTRDKLRQARAAALQHTADAPVLVCPWYRNRATVVRMRL